MRCAKFVTRKQWIVAGSDDMHLRVYNYNTMDKVAAFEAHQDYVRSVAVHPTMTYVLSAADDMLIKLWDWSKGWQCMQVFEGHSHYVMQVAFNPKDPNTFASASLDTTVKVWSLSSPRPNFSLEGHHKGVNCVDYYRGNDRPYLVSGADDFTLRVWDYQTKACIHELVGHSSNVAAVAYHPELPLIVSCAEDGTVRLWHAATYRLEQTLSYNLDRCWSVAVVRGQNSVAVGCDEGSVVVKMGRDEPMASMDSTTGKIVWAKQTEVQAAAIRSLGDYQIQDGEVLPLAVKEMGTADVFPNFLQHSPNGRFITVVGDGEYVIYTAVAWRNKHFGQAVDFAWGDDGHTFVVREASGTLKVFRNFKETAAFKVPFNATKVHGGRLIGVQAADFICFYDWDSATLVRRIDVEAKEIQWNAAGDSVTVVCDTSFYLLRFDAGAVEAALAGGAEIDPEDGLEEAFEVVHEVNEQVRTGLWVGACYIYTNGAWRLNYVVGEEVTTIVHLDKRMYLLGYNATQQRLYLIDRDYNIATYALALTVIEFKTLLLRGDEAAAFALLPRVPKDKLDSVARFLESRGMADRAYEVAADGDYKFDLAVQLGLLPDAMALAELDAENDSKWRQLGDLALKSGRVDLAEGALRRAGDLEGLLLVFTSRGDAAGVAWLAEEAARKGQQNVAFLCRLLSGDVSGCLDTLLSCKRLPEAAVFARSYLPSRVSEVVALWRDDLSSASEAVQHVAAGLADPESNPELFPGLDQLLAAEGLRPRVAPRAAAEYADIADDDVEDLVDRVAELGAAPPAAGGAAPAFAPPPAVEPVAFAPPPAVEPVAFAPPPAVEPEALAPPPAVEPEAFAPPPAADVDEMMGGETADDAAADDFLGMSGDGAAGAAAVGGEFGAGGGGHVPPAGGEAEGGGSPEAASPGPQGDLLGGGFAGDEGGGMVPEALGGGAAEAVAEAGQGFDLLDAPGVGGEVPPMGGAAGQADEFADLDDDWGDGV